MHGIMIEPDMTLGNVLIDAVGVLGGLVLFGKVAAIKKKIVNICLF